MRTRQETGMGIDRARGPGSFPSRPVTVPEAAHVEVLGIDPYRPGEQRANSVWRYRCPGCGGEFRTQRTNLRRIRGCASCSARARMARERLRRFLDS